MVYEGIAGSVKVGSGANAKTIAHMSDFNLDLSKEIKEGSYFGR